jgi:tetratricopeptide (TPR) repeat protein
MTIVLALLWLTLAQEPSTPQAWFDLGAQRDAAGDFKGAAEAWEKARAAGYVPRPAVTMRIAGAYAHAGDKEKAFDTLQKLTANGFGPAEPLLASDDLVSLRADARWRTLVEQANRNGHPCRQSPEFRQFDYWLGEWDVEIGGARRAQSSIQLILDDCVVFENYTDSRGYAGKSFSLWDATTKKWEQRYVDTGGALHHWTGSLEDGVMVFYWTYTANGVKTTQRMKYLKEGADRVRQVIDSSTDDGKSWMPGYNGLYIRRK